MVDTYLSHHGIKDQKWGVRRYQNKDGSLTGAGKRRFKKISNDPEKQRKEKEYTKQILDARAQQEKETSKGFRELGMHEESKKSARLAQTYNKMIKDIDSGTLKAGRDFITAKSKNFGDVNDRIVFKKTDAEIKKTRYKNKDDKTFKKTGIKVERDSLNRVTRLKATNASKRQIRKINKMQRSINRRGDY
jgi:hypothetical protein